MTTTQQDDYFCWIQSDTFESIRLQHHKGIVEAVDDHRFDWSIGKTIKEVEKWIDGKKPAKAYTPDQEKQMLWEEDRKKRKTWEQEHWTEIEGGDGYFH